MAHDLAPPAQHSSVEPHRWGFLRRPFWLFSHLFVAAAVITFINFGFWQLGRHDERQVLNAEIEAVVDAPATVVSSAAEIDLLPEFQPISVTGTLVEPDLVRVVNRSQNGLAGEWVIGIVELADGSELVVNHGFVPIGFDGAVADGPVALTGWARSTEVHEGFGVTDTGTSNLMPRLDTDKVGDRLGRPLPSNWFQMAPDPTQSVQGTVVGPEPVPLPPVTDGPHMGYAVQWFIFATLVAIFYPAILIRRARSVPSDQ